MFNKQFRAGEEWSMADNSEIFKVVVDNGYAEQKIAYYTRNHGVPEIMMMSLPSRAQIGAINFSVDGEVQNSYTVNGTQWTVGSNVPDAESIRGVKYSYSDLNVVLVNNSLIYAGFGGSKVHLGTSLPFGHYSTLNGPNKELINKVKASLQQPCIYHGDNDVAIITEHYVYQESISAAIDYILGDDGKPRNTIQGGIAIVDIGGNTTDISVLESASSVDYGRSGSEKIGVIDVRNDLRELILEKFKLEKVTDGQLDTAIRSGSMVLFGKPECVEAEVAAAKRNTTQKIIYRVEDKVGDAADLDKVIFVGGGAAALRDVISNYKHGHVPDRPEFANARGMLKHMTHAAKRK